MFGPGAVRVPEMADWVASSLKVVTAREQEVER